MLALSLALALGACQRDEEAIQPRRASDIELTPDTATIRSRVPRNATLATLLGEAPLDPEIVSAVIRATEEVFDPRRLAAGNLYELVHTMDGVLRSFEYEIDLDRFLRVSASTGEPNELKATIVPYEKTYEQDVLWGEIDREASSLFAAMDRAGGSPDLSLALADVFSGEIDFNSDIQVGDEFGVAFERVFRQGEFVGYGPIAAAQFENGGRKLTAVRFTPPGGKPGYYDEEGRSLRRFFLKSPLKFSAPVSSSFSNRRLHPILRIYRPHLGVDYRAPSGSPVVAVANGVVVSAGFAGQGGRTVVLRHGSGYETYYLHLSSIANGIRKGARVAQGEVIGRVGMSGLATGPHLDYRIKKNGVFVNPLREHERMPPGEPIAPEFMDLFKEERDRALALLASRPQPEPGSPEAHPQPEPGPAEPAPLRAAGSVK